MTSRMGSRIPGFFRLSLAERQRLLAERLALSAKDVARLGEGLSLEEADLLIENVVGRLSLPLGIATNFLIDGRDYFIPMAIEEPSVVAGASHAAKLARETGGFITEADPPIMTGQIQILELSDLDRTKEIILENKQKLLAEANRLHPTIVSKGGGAVDIKVRPFPQTRSGSMLVVYLFYDVRDSMGANTLNSVLEHLAPLVEEITGGRVNLRILSNLADKRLVRARCRVPFSALGEEKRGGQEVSELIFAAQALAEADPYRAATHNKGILNGIDALALATGNDWRGIEAGAHAFAARSGLYLPLTNWEIEGEALLGTLEMPMAVGIVGGATQASPTARIALKILGVESASELGRVMAAVGLASNLAALKALTTEGIQKGHMRLHARSVALSVGAPQELIDSLVARMVAEGNVRQARAEEILAELQVADIKS